MPSRGGLKTAPATGTRDLLPLPMEARAIAVGMSASEAVKAGARDEAEAARVAKGAVLDVAVDLRRSSPHFGRHVAVELSSENGAMLWVPAGFGHGFLVLSEVAGFAYKVTDYYCAAGERTIAWNDPDLAIPWPVDPAEAIISGKDRAGVGFRDAEVFA